MASLLEFTFDYSVNNRPHPHLIRPPPPSFPVYVLAAATALMGLGWDVVKARTWLDGRHLGMAGGFVANGWKNQMEPCLVSEEISVLLKCLEVKFVTITMHRKQSPPFNLILPPPFQLFCPRSCNSVDGTWLGCRQDEDMTRWETPGNVMAGGFVVNGWKNQMEPCLVSEEISVLLKCLGSQVRNSNNACRE
ncbi:hypothetical protein CEXT_153221 [Caerostris extrusa]|uniref:Uncharacterized protein n=1 Tax=Caerostris extrusa TaxID=172846 RepID=A0AAV4R7S9_CAEEX|nr:hypothetical protein CEXT_153221 [Caerostris extrusa]